MAEYRGRPLYLRIADDLRGDILDGTIAPGAPLPSEAELMRRHGVSRIVVRMALDTLREEGLIDSHQGRGSFVRERPAVRRLSGDRYKRRSDLTPPFASDIKSGGADPAWEWTTTEQRASESIAARLHIDPGSGVMVTEYRFLADGQAIQLSTSYEPLVLTGGTPIERPEGGSVFGVTARMDSIGVRVTRVTEEVRSRAPRPFEVETLTIPRGVHVFHVLRTHWAGDRPVESCDIIVPADRYNLTYTIDVE